MMNNCILITGGSSGIGRACAEAFAKAGHIVYTASRHAAGTPETFGAGSIRPLPMDVCDEGSVAAAAERILRECGAPDVLVHCAGIGVSGAAEDIPHEAAARQMDTNFFGVLRVNRIFLPAMRARGHGHVIVVGSVAGVFPIPFQSHYSASKFALEAYTAALRMEIAPYHIAVSIVEPGDTQTGFTAARTDDCPPDSPYRGACLRSVAKMAHDEQHGNTPAGCAKLICRLTQKKRPPLHKTVGAGYKLLVFLKRLIPERVMLWLLAKMYILKDR